MDKVKRFLVLSGEDKETEWSTLLWLWWYTHKGFGRGSTLPVRRWHQDTGLQQHQDRHLSPQASY